MFCTYKIRRKKEEKLKFKTFFYFCTKVCVTKKNSPVGDVRAVLLVVTFHPTHAALSFVATVAVCALLVAC